MRLLVLACLVIACGDGDRKSMPVKPPVTKSVKKPKKPATFATEAIGDVSKLTPRVRRMLDPEGFEERGAPQPGDWMYEHRENPQTFDAHIRSKPNMPYPGKNTIYLLPLGDFPAQGEPRNNMLDAMTRIVHAYFTLEVKLLPAVPLSEVVAKQRINGGTKKPQLLAPDVLTWLEKKLPADAYALMAVTMTDLYPAEDWNFVFGMASFDERVGVQSFARQDPALFGGGHLERRMYCHTDFFGAVRIDDERFFKIARSSGKLA
jgi:archaemetzincin